MSEHDRASCYCCCDCRHVTRDIAVCTVPLQHFYYCVTLISAWCFLTVCQYVLSSGKDSIVRLWELSTCRSLITYTGAGVTGKQEHRTQAIFNHTEDYG